MTGWQRWVLLGSLLLVAGCPTLNPGSDGTTDTTGGDDGPSVAGGTDGASLDQQFPGCEAASEGDYWRAEILALLNEERVAFGVAPLTTSTVLEAQASQYACEMVYYEFFDHVNPVTGSTLAERAEEFGYDYAVIGENLAAGQRSPLEAVRDWMESPAHRDNILHPRFTEVGVGVRVGGEYGVYWVTEFGRPFGEP